MIGAVTILPRIARLPTGAIGMVLLGLTLAAALGAPWLASHDPLHQQLSANTILQRPSAEHLFGTDNLGRDIFSRVLFGMRLSMGLALTAVLIGIGLGVMIGATASMVGYWWDRVAMRTMDALLAFPVLVLAIAVAVAFGRGPAGVIFAVAFVNVPIFARLARAQGLRILGFPFMAATQVMGCSFLRRLFRHLLPNIMNAILVQSSVSLSFAVLIEAGLSFLGLGIQAPRPALGLMIAEAKAYISLAPLMVLFPALALVLMVVAFNLLGDALAEVTDPRRSAQ
jgi:peptide/nickel transport system permease protein